MRKKRVVSLFLPAATEMVCALGAAGQLVGRSHECDYPPEALALPACTASNIDPQAGSAEIERQVKNLQAQAAPLYRIDAAKLNELRPDIILTQGQCDVCAVSLAEVEAIVAKWPGTRPQIVSLSPARLADIWEDIRRVGVALELGEPGREVLRALKIRVVDIIEKTCVLNQKPKVACLEWIEPLMAAGNWVPELVELAGALNAGGQPGKHSGWLKWEALAQLDPEVIIAMPCGFSLERTRAEMAALNRHPDWPKLRAVKNRRVFVADGNQFFNRPGPRIVESLEMLTEMIHPERVQFRPSLEKAGRSLDLVRHHLGEGWDPGLEKYQNAHQHGERQAVEKDMPQDAALVP